MAMENQLVQAKQAIFPLDLMKSYTANYIKSGGENDFSQYYVAQYNAALFDRNLRNNIVFAPHNLASDQSFNEFQLILCRNVLIYFNQNLQNKVMSLFYDSLCTFGILGLGNKESLLFTDKQTYFDAIDKKQKIFIKTAWQDRIRNHSVQGTVLDTLTSKQKTILIPTGREALNIIQPFNGLTLLIRKINSIFVPSGDPKPSCLYISVRTTSTLTFYTIFYNQWIFT